MKNIFFFVFLLMIAMSGNTYAQVFPLAKPVELNNYPWTDSELIEPSALAAMLESTGAKTPLIFNIGVVEDIKGAKHIGAAGEASNLLKLKNAVLALPKNTLMVVYCGCCPFTKCPNAQPAFTELKKLGFTQVKMLNLPTNLNIDWTTKGYPLSAK